MDRRQPQDIHVPLYNNFIGPGAARTVHYRFTVPKDAAGSITLAAALNYRKFSRDYSIFVGGPNAPELPVTRISADSVVLPVEGSHRGVVTGSATPVAAAHPQPLEEIPIFPIGSGSAGTTTGSASSCRETSGAPRPHSGRSRNSPRTSRTAR